MISAWRATSAAAPPSPSAAGRLFAYCSAFGPGDESAEDATDQRIRAQAIGAVVLVLALAGGKDAGNVGHLVEVDPEAAHGVVHAGEDLHGHFARIVADKLLVDFENAFELAVQRGAVDVGEVEIDHRLAVDAQARARRPPCEWRAWPRRAGRGCRTWDTTLRGNTSARTRESA